MRGLRTTLLVAAGTLALGATALVGGSAQASDHGSPKVRPAQPVPAGATIVYGGTVGGAGGSAQCTDITASPMPVPIDGPVALTPLPVGSGGTVVQAYGSTGHTGKGTNHAKSHGKTHGEANSKTRGKANSTNGRSHGRSGTSKVSGPVVSVAVVQGSAASGSVAPAVPGKAPTGPTSYVVDVNDLGTLVSCGAAPAESKTGR